MKNLQEQISRMKSMMGMNIKNKYNEEVDYEE
jgi:hypothetical protein